MYRLHIEDHRHGRMWLMGWVEAGGIGHPQFSRFAGQAMRFKRFEDCFLYRKKLAETGYTARIC